MRTLTGAQQAVLQSGAQSHYLDVLLYNAAGSSYVSLAALYGYDWIKGAEFGDSIDEYVAKAKLEIDREEFNLSLSPMMATSRPAVDGVSLDIGRRIQILTATTALGQTPQSTGQNLLLWSDDQSSSPWANTGIASSTGSQSDPNGGTNARKWGITSPTSSSIVKQAVSGLTNGTTYCFSVWVKTDSGTKNFRLSAMPAAGWASAFVSSTQTCSTTWTRFSFSFTAAATSYTVGIFSEQKTPFTCDAGNFYTYGTQLEVGTTPGTYVTTTNVAASAAATNDWITAFDGYIDSVDWGPDVISVDCRDLAGKVIQDRFIEAERIYGKWDASRNILLGTVVQPSGNPPNGQPSTSAQYWRCTTAGTTGVTEPAWPSSPSIGTTVTDNGVVWTYQAAKTYAISTAFALGDFVANPSNSLQFWQCTQAGTTGTTANPFPSTPTQGQLITDNGAKWSYFASMTGTPAETLLQSLLNDNLGAGVVTLNTPASSGWYLGPYIQQKDSLFSALSAIAQQLGWDLRYSWSNTLGAFALTFQDVIRSSPSVAWTMQPSQYRDVRRAARSIDGIRNAISVTYSDAESADPTTGAAVRKTVAVTDATSISSYGRRWMEVAESAASGISTNAIATKFANAMLSDLKEPLVDCELEMPYFWPVQLNDYITVKANGVHFDSDQNLAVVAIRHSLEPEHTSTVLSLRGLPTMGAQKHLDNQAGPGLSPPVRQISPTAVGNISISQVVGGFSISHDSPSVKQGLTQTAELHISTTPGFTPSTSTLKSTSLSGKHTIGELTPGTTYYAKVLLRDQFGNVSSSSSQQSFVAGYANLTHINPNIRQNFKTYYANLFTWTSAIGTTDITQPLDTKDFDPGNIVTIGTAGNAYFQFTSTGYFVLIAQSEISGTKPGDGAKLVLQKWNGASWDDFTAGPSANTVSRSNIIDVLEPVFNGVVQASSGDRFRFITRCNAVTSGRTWSWVGPTTSFLGTFWSCVQVLA